MQFVSDAPLTVCTDTKNKHLPSCCDGNRVGHSAANIKMYGDWSWMEKGKKSSANPKRDQAPVLIDWHMNNITGKSQDSPPNFRGGILADAMGLGKTLTPLPLSLLL